MAVRVGPLERKVLEVLWAHGGWMTPREVHTVLSDDRELAYTTVMSVMSNLWQKSVLERHRDGRAFAYHPTESRDERAASLMAEALAAGASRPEVLTNFIGRLSASDRRQLRRMLDGP